MTSETQTERREKSKLVMRTRRMTSKLLTIARTAAMRSATRHATAWMRGRQRVSVTSVMRPTTAARTWMMS
jgi:hypothetical protein